MIKKLDGNELLYPFFKSWLEKEQDTAQEFIKKARDALGIWLHPKYYQELPIIVPYAIRDSSCRRSGPNHTDEWGTPDIRGFFRDDNSLIKNIVNSMTVKSPTHWLKGLKGNGFTASHVWREPSDYKENPILASRRPELNSFVPNLVWLPKQIAKLTDREGSFAQHYLQALSRHIYGKVEVKNGVIKLVNDIWNLLPSPNDLRNVALPDINTIAFFDYQEKIVNKRKTKRIAAIRDACQDILEFKSISTSTLVTKRYRDGLPSISHDNLSKLKKWLDDYLNALQ